MPVKRSALAPPPTVRYTAAASTPGGVARAQASRTCGCCGKWVQHMRDNGFEVVEHIVERFGNLQKILRASIDDLDDVEGVGETRARAIKEGLSRLAETSILDRYS